MQSEDVMEKMHRWHARFPQAKADLFFTFACNTGGEQKKPSSQKVHLADWQMETNGESMLAMIIAVYVRYGGQSCEEANAPEDSPFFPFVYRMKSLATQI